ncbi:endonuclease/exonuclease/phosphatase family protein [Psychromonas sp. PT13]|uniref:endonuclease/exonuclease/phosphatase family protein n=1 Tax=Psychromonas sp. PT13 TaxID=3439547 RepID=UPI003EC083AE
MIKHRYCAIESLKTMGCASTQAFGSTINILMWNIFKCKRQGWQDDFINLMNNKDLVLLQEAIRNTPFDDYFKNSIQYQWIMASSFKNLKTNIETGVKTGANVQSINAYCLASEPSEPISKTKKMLIATLYPLSTSSEPLLVINAHLINFVSFQKFRVHLDQVFNTLAEHKGPIVLAGDFNTWNAKRLQYFNKRAISFGLDEVEMDRQARFNHLYQHLDHIYYRGLTVVKAHVHSDIHSSDHYPISLSLQVTP